MHYSEKKREKIYVKVVSNYKFKCEVVLSLNPSQIRGPPAPPPRGLHSDKESWTRACSLEKQQGHVPSIHPRERHQSSAHRNTGVVIHGPTAKAWEKQP